MMENKETTQHKVLRTADIIVHGDRNDTYGSADTSFNRIAKLWSVIIDKELTAVDVARMMILLKVSRSMGKADIDNWIDIAGYASLAAFCEEPVQEEEQNPEICSSKHDRYHCKLHSMHTGDHLSFNVAGMIERWWPNEVLIEKLT